MVLLMSRFQEPKTSFRTVADWFSPVNNAQRQKDVYKPEYCGSKQSFFSSAEFKSWRDGDTQLLWCHGIGTSCHKVARRGILI